ncbi:MAG: polysaccharide biosynthesis C-terminal domain-containing protein [bacterium]
MYKYYYKIIRANKYGIISNISERIFFFIIFLMIARKYPVEIYGELITIFSLANIFIILFDFGLPIILQREISVSGIKSSGLLSNIFSINLAVFPVYFISSFMCCHFFFSSMPSGLLIVTITIVYLFSLTNILNKALSGLNDFKSQFKSLIVSRALILTIFLPAVHFFKINLSELLLTLLAGSLIQIVFLLTQIKKQGLTLSPGEFNFEKIKFILKLSFPLGLAVVFNFLYDKIDIILISRLTDFNGAAFYNVGYGIFKTSTIAFSFLFLTGLTRISFISKNKHAVRLFFRKYSLVLFYICIFLSFLLFFGAEPIINLIYTDKFTESVIIVKVLSFAITGLALNNLTGVILNGLGFFKMNMIVTLIGLIINVILNLFFIPKYGIVAAAFVTILTEYFIFLGDYYFIRKFYNS